MATLCLRRCRVATTVLGAWYKDGGRVTCDLTPAERCTFARIDDHDHVIEETFPDGRRRRESFDYDRSGNWVTHVSDHGSSRDQAVWRDITYK
jgi:hypothetical protein